MKTKPLALLLLIVVIPLLLLGGLGVRVLNDDKKLHDHQIQTLIASQLKSVDGDIGAYFETLENELSQQATQLATDADSVRAFLRTRPDLRQMLIFDSGFKRLFPPDNAPLTQMERRFLERAGAVLSRLEPEPAALADTAAEAQAAPQKAMASAPVRDDRPDLKGWHVWYAGTGMHHLFWWRGSGGNLIGFELDPVRLKADLIERLPGTGGPEDRLGDARIRLIDSKGTAVYQWGRFEPAAEAAPAQQMTLSPPLGSWKLQYFGSALGAGAGLRWINLAAALTAVGAALFGLAYYLYREHSREMLLAEQRVNFVNQVSHELKTPLTNIRLYAELLDENLPEDAKNSGEQQRFRHYLEVITSESQRLSRLIGNVLNFSRSKRNRLVLRKETAVVDDIIQSTLKNFAPSLKARNVAIEFKAGAGKSVEVDPDALEQILNNLFSNTEKYAAAGGRLYIESHNRNGRTRITVQDHGPGIPKRDAARIFQPFYRISSKTTDGVAGTGIGLSIARELARLHGGDLTLEPSDQGARFKIELNTPVAKGNA